MTRKEATDRTMRAVSRGFYVYRTNGVATRVEIACPLCLSAVAAGYSSHDGSTDKVMKRALTEHFREEH